MNVLIMKGGQLFMNVLIMKGGAVIHMLPSNCNIMMELLKERGSVSGE